MESKNFSSESSDLEAGNDTITLSGTGGMLPVTYDRFETDLQFVNLTITSHGSGNMLAANYDPIAPISPSVHDGADEPRIVERKKPEEGKDEPR